jgi:hypothetical protein
MKIVRAYDDPALAHITHRFNRRCYCDGCHREKGRRLTRWGFIAGAMLALGLIMQAVAELETLLS